MMKQWILTALLAVGTVWGQSNAVKCATSTNQTPPTAVAPQPPKPTFTKQQVARRLRELKELYERGLLTKEFYERKVKECETGT